MPSAYNLLASSKAVLNASPVASHALVAASPTSFHAPALAATFARVDDRALTLRRVARVAERVARALAEIVDPLLAVHGGEKDEHKRRACRRHDRC